MEETRTIVLDKYDYKLMLNALNEFRNTKLQQNIDTEIRFTISFVLFL